ncbi:ribonuclease [Salana multivorans]|uniref:Ribonuclease n=1 Tax=Salana multivorans TaxID=120377 RepID=A0A3N2DA09_9MICO|nr:ribonuclease domain-containing protein [Salana multivorans]ROR96640.1 ribonuclease [Salana multivorans]
MRREPSDIEGQGQSRSIGRPSPGVRAAGPRASPGGRAELLVLQRAAGNRAVVRGLAEPAAAPPVVQLTLFHEGGKGVVVTERVRGIVRWVRKASVQPGGSRHIANIQNRGFPGFRRGKAEHAGGRPYDNNPQPDRHRLPLDQTYQEWDVNPVAPGAARDAERVVTSNTGVAYYSNDHYRNFTRLRD